LQSERDALDRERSHVDRLQENLRSRTEALEKERRQFADTAEARMQNALRDFSNELARRASEQRTARPRVTPSQSALLQRTLEEMRRDLGVKPEAAEESDEGTFAPDDRVRILSFNQDGTVIADNGDSLLVAIGPMKTVVPKTDVRRRGRSDADRARKVQRSEGGGGAAKMDAATRTMAELDVRGKRYAEAEPIVDQWIDEAVLAGNSPLRLIHGKGTGMLGRGLQEFLRAHSHVKNVRYGDENEGGGGVTIFELR
jgi:DNA mismatch repair protein MutS2